MGQAIVKLEKEYTIEFDGQPLSFDTVLCEYDEVNILGVIHSVVGRSANGEVFLVERHQAEIICYGTTISDKTKEAFDQLEGFIDTRNLS